MDNLTAFADLNQDEMMCTEGGFWTEIILATVIAVELNACAYVKGYSDGYTITAYESGYANPYRGQN